MRFFWRRARIDTDNDAARHLAASNPVLPDCLADLAVCQGNVGSVLKRANRRWQHLSPLDGSAAAFVSYLRDLSKRPYELSHRIDYTGEWLQTELYDLYEEVCQVHGLEILGPRVFGRDLGRVGCRRWQADNRENGTGGRPMMVEIPRSPRHVAKAVAELAASGRVAKFPHGNTKGDLPRFLTKRSQTGREEGTAKAA